MDPHELDREVRGELRPLAKGLADAIARRLIMVGELLDVDPEQALAHALAARRGASRIGAVREAVGLAAYRAGDWKLAISELRAHQRISGRQSHLAVIADCERGLGRPERAIDLYRALDPKQVSRDEHIELLIVAAGARRDLGQLEAAAATLQVPALRSGPAQTWVARLRYAYADTVLALGREDEARDWFRQALDADPEGHTDAAERLLELEGVYLDDDDFEPEAGDDEPAPEADGPEAGGDEVNQAAAREETGSGGDEAADGSSAPGAEPDGPGAEADGPGQRPVTRPGSADPHEVARP